MSQEESQEEFLEPKWEEEKAGLASVIVFPAGCKGLDAGSITHF